MILSDNEIRNFLNSTPPLIENFKEKSLQSESYDLTLGSTLSTIDADFQILDLENQKTINQLYKRIPVPIDGYILGPKEYILVSIEEKLNMPSNLTAHIRPRTKFTRIGLLVSSQHCNSSYSGNLSLGLFNSNSFAIRIHSGIKIAQVVFEQLSSIPSTNKQYRAKKEATYQNETEIKGADFRFDDIIENSDGHDYMQEIEQSDIVKKAYEILVKNLGINGE